jgi:hypothetical protein
MLYLPHGSQARKTPLPRSLMSRLVSRTRWEASRAVQIVPRLVNHLFATPFYDVFTRRSVRVHSGAVRPNGRVAVLTIFPQRGLRGSHLRALNYFRTKGCANRGLEPATRAGGAGDPPACVLATDRATECRLRFRRLSGRHPPPRPKASRSGAPRSRERLAVVSCR